jgi:hypothetical protein
MAPFRDRSIQIRFIASLKSSFKSPVDHRARSGSAKPLGLGERSEKNRALKDRGKRHGSL